MAVVARRGGLADRSRRLTAVASSVARLRPVRRVVTSFCADTDAMVQVHDRTGGQSLFATWRACIPPGPFSAAPRK